MYNNKTPTREGYLRLQIKYETLLEHAKLHADDPTGILSSLYHDIIEKYCDLRVERTRLIRENKHMRKLLLKQGHTDHQEEDAELL